MQHLPAPSEKAAKNNSQVEREQVALRLSHPDAQAPDA